MSTTHFSEPQLMPDGSSIIQVTATTWRGTTRAVGVYVVADGKTQWIPVADYSRVMVIGAATGFVAAALSLAAVLRRPPWPDLTSEAMIAIQAARLGPHDPT